MFYTFQQNNSGGYFINNIPHCIIVEADNSKEANSIAENEGVYFYGVDSGIDCECCGDRWDKVDDNEGTAIPLIYGYTPEEYIKETKFRNNIKIYYKSGLVENVEGNKND